MSSARAERGGYGQARELRLGTSWPIGAESLISGQEKIAAAVPPPWDPPTGELAAAGCFVCFPRGPSGPGAAGDHAWAAAALVREGRLVSSAVVQGAAGAPYEPGMLALREGPLLEQAVRALDEMPDALLVDATGRDHPRRAGLAVHLGAVLDLPTAGVTHRPLVAEGDWPSDERGERSPLVLGGEVVGYWLRTRTGARPLAVHAGWRTTPETAADLVLRLARARTPEPLRQARRLAREARA
jgi:deoxyribonuclease V